MTDTPPITTATLITWLAETGRLQPGEKIVNFRLSEQEQQEFREWASKHQPDQWWRDGEKTL